MTIPEIIAELTRKSVVFPHQAISEAIAQREAVVPQLIGLLEEATSNIADVAAQEDYMGHVFAMYLLSQFREEHAYKPLMDLFTADFRHVDRMLGDILTEDLGRMLASVCNGDTSLICGMIENADLNEYVRSAGLDALIVLLAQGVKTREEVMAYFQSLFHGKLERKLSFVWDALISCCCRLCPEEILQEINQAFEDDLVDRYFINLNSVERYLEQGMDAALVQLAQDDRHTFIEDTVSEMANWPCFKTRRQPISKTTIIRTIPKVGRNEPCPCGSGKKYKKCCLG